VIKPRQLVARHLPFCDSGGGECSVSPPFIPSWAALDGPVKMLLSTAVLWVRVHALSVDLPVHSRSMPSHITHAVVDPPIIFLTWKEK
jgi:hypothetical protein